MAKVWLADTTCPDAAWTFGTRGLSATRRRGQVVPDVRWLTSLIFSDAPDR